MKKIIAARLPGQCIRDEGLQVQDSILLWKKIIAARLPGQCIRDERFTGSGQYSAVKKNHCGKARQTLHQG